MTRDALNARSMAAGHARLAREVLDSASHASRARSANARDHEGASSISSEGVAGGRTPPTPLIERITPVKGDVSRI